MRLGAKKYAFRSGKIVPLLAKDTNFPFGMINNLSTKKVDSSSEKTKNLDAVKMGKQKVNFSVIFNFQKKMHYRNNFHHRKDYNASQDP